MSIETNRAPAANPLAQIVTAFPEGVARWVSVAARTFGAMCALYIAFDQSYDRTQVFCVAIIAAMLVTLPPVTRLAPFIAGLGAGILFFAGSMLWAQPAGIGMLIVGVIAIAATLIDTHQRNSDIGLPIGAFFFGLGATVAAVVIIALTVEG